MPSRRMVRARGDSHPTPREDPMMHVNRHRLPLAFKGIVQMEMSSREFVFPTHFSRLYHPIFFLCVRFAREESLYRCSFRLGSGGDGVAIGGSGCAVIGSWAVILNVISIKIPFVSGSAPVRKGGFLFVNTKKTNILPRTNICYTLNLPQSVTWSLNIT